MGKIMEMVITQYPKCCKECFNNGLYTCKRIILENGTCMFYTTEENPIFDKINHEDKQETDNK